jgi:hypothetical protein
MTSYGASYRASYGASYEESYGPCVRLNLPPSVEEVGS